MQVSKLKKRTGVLSSTSSYLLTDRPTTLPCTGVRPAELFFKRKLRTKLPELKEVDEKQNTVVYQQVKDQDVEKKQLAKDFAD